jgi:class 3 adenylate cyclase
VRNTLNSTSFCYFFFWPLVTHRHRLCPKREVLQAGLQRVLHAVIFILIWNTRQQVETIGDAYMAASGHDGRGDHCMALLKMAIGMLQQVREIEYTKEEAGIMNSSHLRIRVGLHTGPTYAGVVGRKCPRYCFFGDTVSCLCARLLICHVGWSDACVQQLTRRHGVCPSKTHHRKHTN